MLWLQGQRDSTAHKAAPGLWLIILGTIPIGVVGLLAKDFIEGAFTKSLYVIGTTMIVWALLLTCWPKPSANAVANSNAGLREALIVGVAQVFALIQGSSVQATIAGGLFAG
ncbi:MAG: undecaprenyl-diphosphate phosphatase [Acidobacteriota bacterium]